MLDGEEYEFGWILPWVMQPWITPTSLRIKMNLDDSDRPCPCKTRLWLDSTVLDHNRVGQLRATHMIALHFGPISRSATAQETNYWHTVEKWVTKQSVFRDSTLFGIAERRTTPVVSMKTLFLNGPHSRSGTDTIGRAGSINSKLSSSTFGSFQVVRACSSNGAQSEPATRFANSTKELVEMSLWFDWESTRRRSRMNREINIDVRLAKIIIRSSKYTSKSIDTNEYWR